MANDVQIDKLSIEVGADAGNAAATLDALSAALDRLAKTGRLTRIQNNLNGLRNQLKGFESINSSIAAIERLKTTLNGLSGIQNAKGLSSTVNVLKRFPEIAAQLQGVNFDGFRENVASLATAFERLGNIENATGLASTMNALRNIPDITQQLNPQTIREFGVAAQGLRDAIRPLATEIERLGGGFEHLPENIRRVITANQIFINNGNQVINNVNRQGNGLARTAIRWSLFGISIRTVARYIGQSLNNFNEYVENVNLFSVSMGEYTQQAAEFAQRMQDVLGVDAGEAMRNMGLIQNLTTSFGIASDKAYILSKNITQLGYDFASFYNISSEEAFTKLQAAISGELEPIRRLGIDISTARLQQELFNLGIEANVNELNQADKSMLRYIAIMKQSTNAQTDMARTLNSPANMMRVFNAQVQLLARSLGSLFIPILNAVLPPLIAFIQVVREAISAIASLFGVEVKFADVTSSVAPSLGGVSDDIDDIGSSAAKAAEEVRYLIGGFDELNVLPDPNKNAGGGGAGGGGGSLLGDIELPEYDMFDGLIKGRVAEYVDKIRNAFQKLINILKPFIPLIKGVFAAFATNAVLNMLAKLGKKLLDLWTKFKALKGVSAIGKAIKTFFGALQLGEPITSAMNQGIITLRKELGPLGQAFVTISAGVGAFVTAFDAMKKAAQGLLDFKVALAETIGATAVFATVAGVVAGWPAAIGVALVGLVGAVTGYAAGVDALAQKAYEASDAYMLYNSILEQNEQISQRCAASNTALDEALEKAAGVENDYSQIRLLVDDIFDLSEKSNKSAAEVRELQAKVELLNGMGLPNLQLEFNETRDAVIQTRDQIYQVIDAMQQEALMAAYQEVLTEAYKAQYQAQVDQALAMQNQQAAAEKYNQSIDAMRQYSDNLDWPGQIGLMLGVDEKYKELAKSAEGAGEAYNTSSAALEEAKATMERANQTVDLYEQNIEDLKNGTISSFDEMKVSVQGYLDEQLAQFDGQGELIVEKGKLVGTKYAEGIELQKQTVSDAVSNMAANGIDTGMLGTDAMMKEYGQKLPESAANGVDLNKYILEDSMTSLAQDSMNAFHDGAWKFGSPSQTAIDFGRDIDQGLANGIRDNTNIPVAAMDEMGRQLSSKLGNIISDLQRQASQASIVINVVTEYSTRGTPAAGVSAPRGRTISNYVPFGNVPALAGGGVLYNPRLVLAGEYANARSNPEIIAPQNVMYDTVSAANEKGSREEIRVLQQILVALQRGNQKIVINGRELFEVMQEEQRRDQMRTGSVYG